jgi:hypothetical protein
MGSLRIGKKKITFPELVEGNIPKKTFEFTVYTYFSYLVYIGKICKESTGMEGHNDSKCDKNPSMGFLRIGKKQFRSLSPSKGTFPKKH